MVGEGVRNIFRTCLHVRHMLVLQKAIVSHWLVRRRHSVSLHRVLKCSFFSEGFLDALTFLSFPTCFAKTISCCTFARTFQTSFHSATSIHLNMWGGVAKGELGSPVFFSQYVTQVPAPSCHVDISSCLHR